MSYSYPQTKAILLKSILSITDYKTLDLLPSSKRLKYNKGLKIIPFKTGLAHKGN